MQRRGGKNKKKIGDSGQRPQVSLSGARGKKCVYSKRGSRMRDKFPKLGFHVPLQIRNSGGLQSPTLLSLGK